MQNVHEHIKASENILNSSNQIDFEATSILEKTKSLKKSHKVIDELKNNNKQLQTDVRSLSQLTKVQKQEINAYREMPLAKQLKRKDKEIDQLNSSIYDLNKEIKNNEYDIHVLNRTNLNLAEKNEKLEQKLFVHESFLSLTGLDKIFKEFKRLFTKNDFSIDIHALKDICSKAIEKTTAVFHSLKDRISFLEKRNIPTEDIVPQQNNHQSFKDISR